MDRVKLVMLLSGVSQKSGNAYFHAWFKQLGDDSRSPQLMEQWLSQDVGAKAVAMGLVELTKTQEPEVLLGFGFGGSITSIELVSSMPFDDEEVVL